MPTETPYNANDLLLFISQIYTILAFLLENNTMIVSVCPNSLLYVTLPITIAVYFYVYNTYKLQSNLTVNLINCVVFFSCAIFTLIQICTICDNKLSNTLTYFAAMCNSCVLVWFGMASIKKIIELRGLINQEVSATIVNGVNYNSINQSIV